jgi:hypothetical protein
VYRVEENGDMYPLRYEPLSSDDSARSIIEAQAAADGIAADEVRIIRR